MRGGTAYRTEVKMVPWLSSANIFSNDARDRHPLGRKISADPKDRTSSSLAVYAMACNYKAGLPIGHHFYGITRTSGYMYHDFYFAVQ